MIIDAHCHFPPKKSLESLVDSKFKLVKEMNEHGIDYAVVIPDNLKGSNIGDLDDVLEQVKSESRLFVLGTMDVETQGLEWIRKLERLLENDKIKGLKIFPGHDPIYPTDERLFPLYDLCVKYDCPMVIHTGENSKDSDLGKYNDPKYIVEIAKKFPKLKIIIAHYFWPKIEYCYNMTKDYENIGFDTSALAHEEVFEISGEETLKKFLKKSILEKRGMVVFGSDFNCEGCNVIDHIKLVKDLNLPKEIENEVFYQNAIELFKLNL